MYSPHCEPEGVICPLLKEINIRQARCRLFVSPLPLKNGTHFSIFTVLWALLEVTFYAATFMFNLDG